MTVSGEPLRVLVIHGPNLNMLGTREPGVYGTGTLDEINSRLALYADEKKIKLDIFQSNHEGAIVDKIQGATHGYQGLIINPAGYTHTSVAIRDALLLLNIPVIEVHISNIYKREPFRHISMIAGAATGQISGLGTKGYLLALEAIAELMTDHV